MVYGHCHSSLLTVDGQSPRGRAQEPAHESPAETQRKLASEVPRMWALAAAAKLAYESGVEQVSLDRVAHRAGVTQANLASMFASREECVAATFRVACALAAERAIPWFAAEVGAVQRIRVAIGQLLAFCKDEPELASVCLSEAPELTRQRAAMIRTLTRVAIEELDSCYADCADSGDLEAAVERAVELVERALRAPDRAQPESLLEPVLVVLLTPHLGAAAARIEASLPATETGPPEPARILPDRRASLDVRLTAHLLSEQTEPGSSHPPAG